MKRQIKFRGFDATGRKGWVYGDLVHNQKVTVTGLEPRVMVGGYEVAPESVGQYIGMLDNKGTEIYEGDVVCRHDQTFDVKEIGVVVYNESLGAFLLQVKKGEFTSNYTFAKRIVENDGKCTIEVKYSFEVILEQTAQH